MKSRLSSLVPAPKAGGASERDLAAELFAELVPNTECALPVETALTSAGLVEPAADCLTDLFVPDHYETNYAYPLLVWLENGPIVEGRLERRMRQVSDRNHFGASIVVDESDQFEEQLRETFLSLRRQFHLNTERVYLLGCGSAGAKALATGLNHPEWFAGVAAVSSEWPESPHLLLKYHELRGKRVLLGVTDADSAVALADSAFAARLLWTAGLHVTTLSTAGDDPIRPMLREIDRWVMQAIAEPELVC
jgi:phospholipase/carboxylesterase